VSGKIIDDSICPFCQSKNQCKAHAKEPCWCNHVSVPQALLDLLATETKGKACICLECIQAFKKQPDDFIKKQTNV